MNTHDEYCLNFYRQRQSKELGTQAVLQHTLVLIRALNVSQQAMSTAVFILAELRYQHRVPENMHHDFANPIITERRRDIHPAPFRRISQKC
jgi:hypothetical protein